MNQTHSTQPRTLLEFTKRSTMRLERARAKRDLKAAFQRIESIFASITDCFLSLDTKLRFTYVNHHAETYFGLTKDRLLGRSITTVFPNTKGHPLEFIFWDTLKKQQTHHVEFLSPTTGKWIALAAYPSVDGLSVYFHDITERKVAEQALRKSEENFRAMFNVSSIGMAEGDVATHRLLRVNQAFCEITGYSEAELTAMTVDDLNHPEDRQLDRSRLKNLVRGLPGNHETEKRYLRRDGTVVWVHVNANVIRDGDGKAVRIFAVIQDITTRKLTEEALREAHDELSQANAVLQAKEIERRKLLIRLIAAQEEERQRISLELHDQTGQDFAALRAMLATLKDPLRSHPEHFMTLERVERLAERLAATNHSLARELRAPRLNEGGLVRAISHYVEDWSAHNGIAVDFHCLGKQGFVPKLTEVALYRVIQEALTNVLKHARARNITILIEFFPDRIRAVIEDDGIGFNPDAVPVGPLRLGLQGMRERVKLVDGHLDIESTPGSGTALYVTLPLMTGVRPQGAL